MPLTSDFSSTDSGVNLAASSSKLRTVVLGVIRKATNVFSLTFCRVFLGISMILDLFTEKASAQRDAFSDFTKYFLVREILCFFHGTVQCAIFSREKCIFCFIWFHRKVFSYLGLKFDFTKKVYFFASFDFKQKSYIQLHVKIVEKFIFS